MIYPTLRLPEKSFTQPISVRPQPETVMMSDHLVHVFLGNKRPGFGLDVS